MITNSSLPAQYGWGRDRVIIVTGSGVSIKDIYELDSVSGVTTWRGAGKGLNYGAGSYAPKLGRFVQASNFMVLAGASIIAPHPTSSADTAFGVIWISCLNQFSNAGAVSVNGGAGVIGARGNAGAAGGNGGQGGGGGGGAGGETAGSAGGVGQYSGQGAGTGGGAGGASGGGGGTGVTGANGKGGNGGVNGGFEPAGGGGGGGVSGISTGGRGGPALSAVGGVQGAGGSALTVSSWLPTTNWYDLYGGSGGGGGGTDGSDGAQTASGSGGGGGGGMIRIYAPIILSTGTISVNGGVGANSFITSSQDGGCGGGGGGGSIYLEAFTTRIGTGLVTSTGAAAGAYGNGGPGVAGGNGKIAICSNLVEGTTSPSAYVFSGSLK